MMGRWLVEHLKTKEEIEAVVTSEITNMSEMFSCCNFDVLDLSKYNTSNVLYMDSMFWNCDSLKSVNLSSFNTTNVKDMSNMFGCCIDLENLDLSNFNTSKVTDMCIMFYRCESLTELNLKSFDTSRVVNMSYMFEDCGSITNLDLCYFNTQKLIKMTGMFSRCSSLKSINLSSFDTSKVVDMKQLFEDCTSLNSIDLNSFDTSNVIDMSWMFCMCKSLERLDLSSFNFSNVKYAHDMFVGCAKLKEVIVADDQYDICEKLFKDSLPEHTKLIKKSDYGKMKALNLNTNITYKTENITGDLLELFHSVGWHKNTNKETIEKAIANSSHIVAAYDGDKIVGLIRSMDDDCWNANIDCCVVHKNYQNLGIGTTMLRKLLKSIEHIENISVSPNESDTDNFYKKCNFVKVLKVTYVK